MFSALTPVARGLTFDLSNKTLSGARPPGFRGHLPEMCSAQHVQRSTSPPGRVSPRFIVSSLYILFQCDIRRILHPVLAVVVPVFSLKRLIACFPTRKAQAS
jgi:hypothetical protein